MAARYSTWSQNCSSVARGRRPGRAGLGGDVRPDVPVERRLAVALQWLEPIADGLTDEGRHEGRHDDPAVRFQPDEHIVHDIARMIAERPSVGVGDRDRRRRDVEHVMHRLRRGVRHIDQHAEPVHPADDLAAEIREPVVSGLVGSAVHPRQRLVVAKRHHAGAERMEDVEHLQPVADADAALDADEGGDLALPLRLRDVGGAQRRQEASGCSAFSARIDWISSSVKRVGSGWFEGQKAAQTCPPTLPSRRRGMSVS